MQEFIGLQDSPEELEIRRRQKTAKRLRLLTVICIVTIGARFLIKDPAPPKAPDRSKRTVRYVPGMLDDLPASTINRMDPTLVAQMRIAEAKYKQERSINEYPGFAKGPYQPTDVPITNPAEEEEIKQMQFVYEKKKKNLLRAAQTNQPVDLTKTMLIRFRSGGFIKAENTMPSQQNLKIQVDRTLFATLPHQMVRSVEANAAKWQAPIPKGFVELKPSKGITITVHRETAKRITVQQSINEI